MQVPDLCFQGQPLAMAYSSAAPYSGGRAAFLQKCPVDLLDVDAAVLDGLGRVGDLQQLTGGLFGVGERAVSGVLHAIGSLSRKCRRPSQWSCNSLKA
jgi:hypothetical protein